MKRTLSLALVSFLIFSSAQEGGVLAQGTTAPTRSSLRVLFVGNSYTFVNNLPDIVAGIAAVDPKSPTIVPVLATSGGKTLRWHLENGSAVKSLANGKWDFVVLQEQSLLGGRTTDGISVVGDPAEFHAPTREWVSRIRAAGATPILYMTWAPREARLNAAKVQKDLADAYLNIGRDLKVKVAPVGLAWAEARRRLNTLDLHTWDASHPAHAGSYLAALVIYSTLTGKSPLGAPAVIQGRPAVAAEDEMMRADSSLRVPLIDVGQATATALQEVAWTVALQGSTAR